MGRLRILAFVVVLTMLASLVNRPLVEDVSAADDPIIKVNGEFLDLSEYTNIVIKNGVIFAPMYPIFEALGAKVEWNGDTQTAAASKDGKQVLLTVDKPAALIDGKNKTLATPPFITDGFVMVPLRLVSEGLGAEVQWDNILSVANIKTQTAKAQLYIVDSENEGKHVALPQGKVMVSKEQMHKDLKIQGPQYMEIETLDVKDLPFKKVMSVSTLAATEKSQDAQIYMTNSNPIKTGDVILLSFYMRSVSSAAELGIATSEVIFELNASPYTKLVMTSAPMTQSWQHIFIPIQAKQDFAADGSQVCLRAGYGVQTFEIADIEIVNYGDSVALSDLPYTKVKYEGYDYNENDKWRVEANERIEIYRKGDLSVLVRDEAGNPIKDVEVEVGMTRHDFIWGTAVHNRYLFGSDDDSVKYRDNLLKYFNTGVMEYEMKWGSIEENPQRMISTYNWLNDSGLNVRGHTLVWDRAAQLPPDIPDLLSDPDKLKQRIYKHITDIATQFSGRLNQWDVLNEPIQNNLMTDVVGTKERAEWFKLAKAADPNAMLFVNETQIVGRPTNVVEDIKKITKEMLELGAPVEGIGVQGHFHGSACNPEDFYKQLDNLAELGLNLAITEYDITTDDEQLQANFIRDILTVSFSHPKMTAFLMWGFWDGQHWKNNSPMFRKDWSLKPSGQQYSDLVYGKWWTDKNGNTDSAGRFDLRGFYGEYNVTVKHGGKTYKTVFHLTEGGEKELIVTIGNGGANFSPAKYQRPIPGPLR